MWLFITAIIHNHLKLFASRAAPKTLTFLFGELACEKKRTGNFRTAKNYLSCLHKLCAYLGEEADDFFQEQVTSAWVAGYVNWLWEMHPCHPRTVDFYVRGIRAMYNRAVAPAGNAGRQDYLPDPFKGIRPGNGGSSKRALPANETKKLLNPDFRTALHPRLHESLDVLTFMLFMRGMVFQDVYNLRRDAVDRQGCLHYRRSKTGSVIKIDLPPEACGIMTRYQRDDSPYVFPFLHEGRKKGCKVISEESALRRVDSHALIIGQQFKLSITLSTYVMRHTWATLMLESGKPVELISQCLGHAGIRTTQIYLSRISDATVNLEVNDMFDRMLRSAPHDVKKRERKNEYKKDLLQKRQEEEDVPPDIQGEVSV